MANKNIVSLHIKETSKGGYHLRHYWQVFVDGHMFYSSNSVYYFEHQARSAGVIALQEMNGYFTAWKLSDSNE